MIKIIKKQKLILLFVAILLNSHTLMGQTYTNKLISKISDLKAAVNNALPGDTITVRNGIYDSRGSITITNHGNSNNNIFIQAETSGSVELTGETYFDFRQCSFITVKGFIFSSTDQTVIKLQACNNIRITNNTFSLHETESNKWILIGGVWNDANALSFRNRIDHNLFKNKTQAGNFITIDGSGEPTYKSSQYDIIDHNHFINNSPRIENEKESIRIGWSELSNSSGFTTVEYNLFEDCNGDPEIISVKTCDDTLRYNTFRRCMGTLSLRHGNRSMVYGNYFFGENISGTGGIRIYGDDHKIFNNYFQDLTGTKWDAPITLTNGDYDGGSNLSKHFRLNRAQIVFNTLVDNDYAIEIGFTNNGSYSKPPRDVTFANNLIVSKKNQIVNILSNPVNISWINNIFFTQGNSLMGAEFPDSMVLNEDPKLIWEDIQWKLSFSSIAINKASSQFNFVSEDIEGQFRSNLPDVGSDEFSALPALRKPLSSNDVGPSYSKITSVDSNYLLPNELLLWQNYPNPFNPNTNIDFYIPREGEVNLIAYDILGHEVLTIINEYLSVGKYSINFDASVLSSGIYFYRINSAGLSITKKMVYLK